MTVRITANSVAISPCCPIGRPSRKTARSRFQASAVQEPRVSQWYWMNSRSKRGLGLTDQATPNGISPGGWIPDLGDTAQAR